MGVCTSKSAKTVEEPVKAGQKYGSKEQATAGRRSSVSRTPLQSTHVSTASSQRSSELQSPGFRKLSTVGRRSKTYDDSDVHITSRGSIGIGKKASAADGERLQRTLRRPERVQYPEGVSADSDHGCQRNELSRSFEKRSFSRRRTSLPSKPEDLVLDDTAMQYTFNEFKQYAGELGVVSSPDQKKLKKAFMASPSVTPSHRRFETVGSHSGISSFPSFHSSSSFSKTDSLSPSSTASTRVEVTKASPTKSADVTFGSGSAAVSPVESVTSPSNGMLKQTSSKIHLRQPGTTPTSSTWTSMVVSVSGKNPAKGDGFVGSPAKPLNSDVSDPPSEESDYAGDRETLQSSKRPSVPHLNAGTGRMPMYAEQIHIPPLVLEKEQKVTHLRSLSVQSLSIHCAATGIDMQGSKAVASNDVIMDTADEYPMICALSNETEMPVRILLVVAVKNDNHRRSGAAFVTSSSSGGSEINMRVDVRENIVFPSSHRFLSFLNVDHLEAIIVIQGWQISMISAHRVPPQFRVLKIQVRDFAVSEEEDWMEEHFRHETRVRYSQAMAQHYAKLLKKPSLLTFMKKRSVTMEDGKPVLVEAESVTVAVAVSVKHLGESTFRLTELAPDILQKKTSYPSS
eukprot:ANDGO_05474.mRNA.1 hypothetical protein